RHFLGTSENAIRIQIFVALIAHLLLRVAQASQTQIKQPLAFARLIRLNLMHKRPINALKKPVEPPPKYPGQLTLDIDKC
ncbi:MAG: IS4 family transposase, partial [Hyphomicrobiales bacterium]